MKDIIDNPKKYVIHLLIIGLLMFAICFYFVLDENSRNFLNGFSIFGTSFTLIGFVYTYLQLANLSSASEQLTTAVQNNNSSFNKVVTLSTVSASLIEIFGVQDSLKHDLQVALYKMRNLKLKFLEIKNQKDLLNNLQINEFQKSFEDFCVDVKNLDNHLSTKTSITIEKISGNLDDMITILKESEVALKIQIQKTL